MCSRSKTNKQTDVTGEVPQISKKSYFKFCIFSDNELIYFSGYESGQHYLWAEGRYAQLGHLSGGLRFFLLPTHLTVQSWVNIMKKNRALSTSK